MDNTVNGNGGESHAPFKGATKKGVMGANYGVTLAAVTDGLSNTIFVAEMRAGLVTSDGRGVWAMGFGGSSLCCEARSYNPGPNCQLHGHRARPTATTAATRPRPA